MKRFLPCLSTFVVVSAFAVAVQAADWPGFRGPLSNGISPDTGFPVKWTSDNFLWKMKMPGSGAASPIVYGDKLFVVCYTGYGQNMTKGSVVDKVSGKATIDQMKQLRRHLLCVDAKTGQELWRQSVEPVLPDQSWEVMIREHGYTSSTPVTDGERVYVFYGKTGVFAYDFNGKELWRASVGTDYYLYGSASSLAVHKNLLFVNASAESKSIVALDTATGKEVWRNKKITTTWASPVVVETKDGKHEVVLSQPKIVMAFNPENGEELWRCQGLPHLDTSSSFATPVTKDGIIYMEGGGGASSGPVAMAIRPGGRGDVTKTHVLWRTPKTGGTINSPIVSGEYMYIVENSVTCVRLEDGKQVYKQRLYSGTYPYASPVLVGDKIYQPTRYDGIYVIDTGNKFQLLAQNTLPGDESGINASPAVSNGRMYIRSNHYLYCIGAKS